MLLAALFTSGTCLLLEDVPYHTCGRTAVDGADIRISDCFFEGLQTTGTGTNGYSAAGNGHGGAIFIERSSARPAGGGTGFWFFRVYLRHTRFENCYASVRGGAVDLVAQAEDVNTTDFTNCSSGGSAGAGYLQAVGFPPNAARQLGWVQVNTTTIAGGRCMNSTLSLNASFHQSLPFGLTFKRDQNLLCVVFNATGARTAASGGALFIDHQMNVTLSFARFVSNRGQNILRIGVSEGDSPPITCAFFVNNTAGGGATTAIRGIIYVSDSYNITDTVFIGNRAAPYVVVNGTGSRLVLSRCIFDSPVVLTGKLTTIDCRTSYNGEVPDACSFPEPTGAGEPSPTEKPGPPTHQPPPATDPPPTTPPAALPPRTARPATPRPATLRPATPRPPSGRPSTAVPATAVPATVPSKTAPPPTAVPATAVPATVVPATVPSKTAPPPTAAPATAVPATPAEPTAIPGVHPTATPRPVSPQTAVPPTPGGRTPTPQTPIPATVPQPTTLRETAPPVTPVPRTPAQSPRPATAEVTGTLSPLPRTHGTPRTGPPAPTGKPDSGGGGKAGGKTKAQKAGVIAGIVLACVAVVAIVVGIGCCKAAGSCCFAPKNEEAETPLRDVAASGHGSSQA